jgi:NAD(P)-dependent dehydrogenase (short-subunit alcohol dehydrogenase family)
MPAVDRPGLVKLDQRSPPGSLCKERAVATIPLGRIEQPEDVAGVVAFLVSADGSYITAQAINVCGGLGNY